jgi:glycosyltransferase involved in cell wall biosynthesis
MLSKKRIFFIGPLQSTFTRNDVKILSDDGNRLYKEDAVIGRGAKGIFGLLLSTIRAIPKVIASDIIYCWFADYATLFPSALGRLLGKKIFVIAGGFDVTNMPEYGTGAILKPARWFCTRNTFRLATKIFPVSNHALRCLIDLVPSAESKAETVYNCINYELFSSRSVTADRDIVLTVNQADNLNDYRIKGMPEFIETARRMPDTKFVLAGLRGIALDSARKSSEGMNNLEIIQGPLSLIDELLPLYYRSIAYLQPSHFESFGVAVAEAMACGALPVVSHAGALPEVVGDDKYCGDTIDDYVAMITTAKSATAGERTKISQSAKRFDISERRRALLEMIR